MKRLSVVEVEIHQEPTRHIVDVPELLKWIEEKSMHPAQETRKAKLRKLLGNAVGPGIKVISSQVLSQRRTEGGTALSSSSPGAASPSFSIPVSFHQGNPSTARICRGLYVQRILLQNAVNAVTGKKFKDLREELLLVRIKNLLASAPNTTIRQISLEVGYRSPRSFARAVRRGCGLSPKQLRTRIVGELLV